MQRDIFLTNEIQRAFPEDTPIYVQELIELHRRFDPFVNDNTIKSRITRLIKTGVIRRIGRGVYMLGNEIIYIPPITRSTKRIYNITKKAFPLLDICIWDTQALNHFMVQQPANFHLIIDVERHGAESVFYHLKERNNNIYLNPSEEVYFNYIVEKKFSIIIKTLISEAPTQELYNTKVPSLEKILVDIFCDHLIFQAQQGEEMDNIWLHAIENYTINQNTLFRYADRRGRKKEIYQYFLRISNY